jgi:predicted nucleotide-binding protein (sugar kinase/HSP70/actin superfamily)
MTDRVYHASLDRVCQALALPGITHPKRLEEILIALTAMRDAFRVIPQDRVKKKLLIGIVGEIFCRLNDFSNAHLIRLIEKNGGEAWMSDVAEWVWYTTDEVEKNLIRVGRRYSLPMFSNRVRQKIMRNDEQRMLSLFREDFFDYPEPHHITQVLDLSRPYLPREGAHGEMVISTGKALWFQRHGAAGVIDISPFTCMNGIVCESVYPRLSKQFDGFPIRVFYFDGLQSQFDNDVEIFMELARNYHRTRIQREGPTG